MEIRCRFLAEAEPFPGGFRGRIGIVIPAHNEAEHLPALLERCRAVNPAVVVVVDDASSDATPEVLAREAQRADGARPLVLRHPRNLGKQGAVRTGLRALAPLALDGVALLDGDGQHDPAELPRLAALLAEADVVIGARSHAEMPPQRRFSNWLVNQGFRRLAGFDVVDMQSGLRLYPKAAADLLAERLPVEGGYGVEYECLAILALHARDRGEDLRIAAAPASCAYGAARSGIGPRQVVSLGLATVRQAASLRRAAWMEPTDAGRRWRERTVVVELHDVHPGVRDDVLRIREALAAVGVDRVALLAVPAWEDERGRRLDLRDDPRLVEWLAAEQAGGSEIVQHGLTHRAPGPPPPDLVEAALRRWVTRGCDEFARLEGDEARERLLAGREILRQCGLCAAGFVAPVWRQSPAALRAVEALGFRYTAFLRHLQPLDARCEPVFAPALTFAAADGTTDLAKRAAMLAWERAALPAALVRVALHPQDVRRSGLLAHVVERIRGLLRHRRLATCASWLAERRAPAVADPPLGLPPSRRALGPGCAA